MVTKRLAYFIAIALVATLAVPTQYQISSFTIPIIKPASAQLALCPTSVASDTVITSSCYVDPHYAGMQVNQGVTLTINPGVTVTLQNNLNNFGTIINNGRIDINPGSLNNFALTDNYGSITVQNFGTLNNMGTFNNEPGASVANYYSLIMNQAVFNELCGSSYSNTGSFYDNPITYETCNPTTTGVLPSPSSVIAGGVLNFTATVTDTSLKPTLPQGTVKWSDGGAGGKFGSLSACTLSGSGPSSSCMISYTAPSRIASPTITASFIGGPSHSPSSGTSALVVTVPDSVPPTLVISQPAGGAVLDHMMSVNGTASDDTSVASVTGKVDGYPPSAATTSDGYAHWSLATPGLVPGPHTIEINATDSAHLVASQTISITINDCLPGTYLSGSTCVPAPAGSFVSAAGAVSATLCPAGTYSSAQGQTSCTDAPAGSFVSTTGATQASLCPAGTFTSSAGQSSCTPALPGSYVPTAGSTSAVQCPAGLFTNSTGSISCTPAPAGSYVPTAGSDSTILCPVGTFANSTGSISCTPAPAGSFASTAGSTEASLCPAGSFTDVAGQTSCTPASPGYYVGSQGATSATICPAGTYCPNPGTATPLPCPPGDFCGAGTVTPIPQTESVPPSSGGGQVTFSSNSGGFATLSPVQQSGLPTAPPAGSYPFGFFSWTITGIPVGGSATVSMTYPSNPGTVYEKLIGSTWYQIPVTETTLSNGSVVVRMTLTDGAAGQDADLAANGQITDPGGLLAGTQGKVTGGGKIGNDTSIGFEVSSGDGKVRGTLDYQDRGAAFKLHSEKISFLSVDPTVTQATFMGQASPGGDDGKKDGGTQGLSFIATVTDPDKTGSHDAVSITVTDGSGKTIYKHSGTIKGHVEIHKLADRDGPSDSGK